jgi:hypothetical protein
MAPTENQMGGGAKAVRRSGSTLADHEATFAHWHFCEFPERHEGRHRCMSCHIEFGPTRAGKSASWTAPTEDETPPPKIP